MCWCYSCYKVGCVYGSYHFFLICSNTGSRSSLCTSAGCQLVKKRSCAFIVVSVASLRQQAIMAKSSGEGSVPSLEPVGASQPPQTPGQAHQEGEAPNSPKAFHPSHSGPPDLVF